MILALLAALAALIFSCLFCFLNKPTTEVEYSDFDDEVLEESEEEYVET
jgi:hypothetical protein